MSSDELDVLRATSELGETRAGRSPKRAVLLVSPPPEFRILAMSGTSPATRPQDAEFTNRSLVRVFPAKTQSHVLRIATEAAATGMARGVLLGEGPAAPDTELVCMALRTKEAPRGRPEYLAVVLTELPAQGTQEGQLARLAEENEQLREEFQQFAYAASHDLQEPLRMITSYLGLLERRYGSRLDAEADEFIRFATDGAARLRAMIEGLLRFSRVSTQGGPMEAVAAASALARARSRLEGRIQSEAARITHGPLPVLLADRQQLTQLFEELVENALEFRGDAAPRIEVTARQDGPMWEISVKDNGQGIAPDFHESIFHAFETLHNRGEHPGIGMGLCVARRIVTRHGGRIWVESEEGKGAVFRFTLRATPEVKGSEA